MSDYHTAGRRVDRDHVPFRQQFESSRHSQGKREEEPRPNSRWMRQLLASALLFALLVGVICGVFSSVCLACGLVYDVSRKADKQLTTTTK